MLITCRSWWRNTAYYQGPHREVKAGYKQRECQGLGYIPLLRSMAKCSWTRVRLVNSNQKSRVLVSSMELLSKGCTRENWEAGRTVDRKGFGGRSYQKLTFACDSGAATQSMCLQEYLLVSV